MPQNAFHSFVVHQGSRHDLALLGAVDQDFSLPFGGIERFVLFDAQRFQPRHKEAVPLLDDFIVYGLVQHLPISEASRLIGLKKDVLYVDVLGVRLFAGISHQKFATDFLDFFFRPDDSAENLNMVCFGTVDVEIIETALGFGNRMNGRVRTDKYVFATLAALLAE